jgi:hypothetical protein
MSTREDRRAAYSEKLRDPRWQKLRLEIFERDKWECQCCGRKDKTLNVHHRWYEKSGDPWDSPSDALVTLCCDCHEIEPQRKQVAEEKFNHAKRHLLGLDLMWLSLLIEDGPLPRGLCEAISCLPTEVILEAFAKHCEKINGISR